MSYHQSPFNDIKTTLVINPADLGDGATKGTGLDMSEFMGVTFDVNCGALGSGGTVDVKAQQSADDVDGDYADMVDVNGDNIALTQVADTGDNHIYRLDVWRPSKRWVRVVVTVGGSGVAVVIGSVAHQYGAGGALPITQSATVGQFAKFQAA